MAEILRLFKFFLTHKIIFMVGVLIFGGAGYFTYGYFRSPEETVRYITAQSEKGMLITSISGTGQVSATREADVKSEVSGKVLKLNVMSGQAVTTSTVLVLIDDSDTQKELRDAQIAYDNARLDLDELLAPPEEIDVLKAESALAEAKRNLDELLNPGEDDLYDAETALTVAREDLIKLKNNQEKEYKDAIDLKSDAEDDLTESYEDALNTLTSVFFELPTIITGLYDILYSQDISTSEPTLEKQINTNALINSIDFKSNDEDMLLEMTKFVNTAEEDYAEARDNFDDNFEHYRDLSRYSEHSEIEDVLDETVVTVRAMAETVKSEGNMLDYWVDSFKQLSLTPYSKVTSYQTSIQSYTSKINSYLSSTLSAQRAIEDYEEAIIDAEENIKEIERDHPIDLAAAERVVKEKEDALYDLKNPEQYEIDDLKIIVEEKELTLKDLKDGADENDIRAQKLNVQERYEEFLEVREKLAEHSIKPLFDGIVSTIEVSLNDEVNSGSVIGSIITDQQIIELILNEIDIASIKVGQSATITFDAVSGLTVTGKVIEVDTVGTVSQGVVSYTVKIGFDVEDERIKPGMSTSVSIITSSKPDALLVPLGAVKISGSESYVEVLVNNKPQRKAVTTGDSNDTMIEITSGLSEGETVITQAISSTNSSTQSGSASSQNNRGFGGGGDIMRIMR